MLKDTHKRDLSGTSSKCRYFRSLYLSDVYRTLVADMTRPLFTETLTSMIKAVLPRGEWLQSLIPLSALALSDTHADPLPIASLFAELEDAVQCFLSLVVNAMVVNRDMEAMLPHRHSRRGQAGSHTPLGSTMSTRHTPLGSTMSSVSQLMGMSVTPMATPSPGHSRGHSPSGSFDGSVFEAGAPPLIDLGQRDMDAAALRPSVQALLMEVMQVCAVSGCTNILHLRSSLEGTGSDDKLLFTVQEPLSYKPAYPGIGTLFRHCEYLFDQYGLTLSAETLQASLDAAVTVTNETVDTQAACAVRSVFEVSSCVERVSLVTGTDIPVSLVERLQTVPAYSDAYLAHAIKQILFSAPGDLRFASMMRPDTEAFIMVKTLLSHMVGSASTVSGQTNHSVIKSPLLLHDLLRSNRTVLYPLISAFCGVFQLESLLVVDASLGHFSPLSSTLGVILSSVHGLRDIPLAMYRVLLDRIVGVLGWVRGCISAEASRVFASVLDRMPAVVDVLQLDKKESSSKAYNILHMVQLLLISYSATYYEQPVEGENIATKEMCLQQGITGAMQRVVEYLHDPQSTLKAYSTKAKGVSPHIATEPEFYFGAYLVMASALGPTTHGYVNFTQLFLRWFAGTDGLNASWDGPLTKYILLVLNGTLSSSTGTIVTPAMPVPFCSWVIGQLKSVRDPSDIVSLSDMVPEADEDVVEWSCWNPSQRGVDAAGVPLAYNVLRAYQSEHIKLFKSCRDSKGLAMAVRGMSVYLSTNKANTALNHIDSVRTAYFRTTVPYGAGIVCGRLAKEQAYLKKQVFIKETCDIIQSSSTSVREFVAGMIEACDKSQDEAIKTFLSLKTLHKPLDSVFVQFGGLPAGTEERAGLPLPPFVHGWSVGNDPWLPKWGQFLQLTRTHSADQNVLIKQWLGLFKKKEAPILRMFIATLAFYHYYDAPGCFGPNLPSRAKLVAASRALDNSYMNGIEHAYIVMLSDPRQAPVWNTSEPDFKYLRRNHNVMQELYTVPGQVVDADDDEQRSHRFFRQAIALCIIYGLGVNRSGAHWSRTMIEKYIDLKGCFLIGHAWNSPVGNGIHIDCGMKDAKFSSTVTAEAMSVRSLGPLATR
ncbi:hypothetical protein KIPB_003078 [Kipferlia bialata]|uniref:Uncharacterized protein n=1 Tax=Kipferlia bialata TaxID=797122 RepID=A0A9K3CRL1_9EUKA|nr:hypothetical protein KIPB_003078 [Kipferlia bialata]|eukprot:g3078.t1